MPDSLGTVLMLGGGIGFVLFSIVGIVSWLHFSKKGKALLHAIEAEYE